MDDHGAPELDGVHCADALDVLRSTCSGSVDLIYIDPPFGTGSEQRMDRIRTGVGESTRSGFGGRTYAYEVVSSLAYEDKLPFGEYLVFLESVLIEIHRVLKDTGSLYLHLDWRAIHYARFLLDDIFGIDHFLNEIVWAYDYGGRHRDRWARKHDTILWYSKGSTWTFNADEIERIPYMAPSLVGEEKARRGKLPTDVWWMTIVPTNSQERTGYPTQKPLALLKRIVTASSNPGDVVADYFCGSGTTLVAAASLGRRFVGVDRSEEAVALTKRRLSELHQT